MTSVMKVGIIGLGVVGLSFASVLGSKRLSVIGMDSDLKKIEKITSKKSLFFEPRLESFLKKALSKSLEISFVKNCDLIFLTVGTPKSKSGFIDLSMIKNASKNIGISLRHSSKKPIIVVKSTVIPGTTANVIKPLIEKMSRKKAGKGFEIIANPEFLREGNVISDTLKPHLVVIGGSNSNSVNRLKKFYRKLYDSKIKFMITNTQTAEMIKYANNSFLATKISFINQISSLCQSIPGISIDEVAEGIGVDPRIGRLFLNAGPGYGGSCLPKDLETIIQFSSKIGVNPILLKAVQQVNDLQIKQIVHLLEKNLGTIKNKRITILGLSFKENSDDVRESRSIELIKILLKKKSKITVHDPKAMKNTEAIFKNKITYADSLLKPLDNCDCVIIMTPWKIYTKLKNNSFKNMKRKLIIDTRRILSRKNLNAEYFALGMGN
ncbi:MAG: UDP-glucose 6-dehydrogenase [Thaumarchaeota archaeon]|nr:MAG: UDP-glucose 6-dehydrogenase [Nitrososphaerota archaeon]